jgi:nitroreductase
LTNATIECFVSRATTELYDPAVILSDDRPREMLRVATAAPTSFYIQNRRFISGRAPKAKARLRPIDWGQPKITEAGAAEIVIDPILSDRPTWDKGWIGCCAGEGSPQAGRR